MPTFTVVLTGNETYNGSAGGGGSDNNNYVVTDNGVGSNTVTLGGGIDQFNLTSGSNTITLGNGADQVSALSSNTITVGDGNDMINGVGINTISTGNGASNVSVTGGSNTITVGLGSNAIALGTLDSNKVSTGAGNNVVSVSAATVSGDTIHGAVTSLDGSTNQLVLTTAGVMAPVNVYGFETYALANGGTNSLTLSDGNFTNLPGGQITVFGGNSGNTVNASALSAAHAVVIYGGTGADALTGGAGNDSFVISAPVGNVLNGGAGTNTLDYSNFAGGITLNLVTDEATAANNGAIDTFVGMEAFKTGGGNNTFIAGPGGAHTFIGGVAGVNTLSYAAATSEVYVDVVHGLAYDSLNGATTVTVDGFANIRAFIGGSGNNVFIAGPGGSHMFNGGVGGVNTLSYAAATSEVYVDLVHGLVYDNLSGAAVTVDHFTNFPAFVGGSGNNTFVGGAGNHVIDGGAGGVNTLDYSAAPGAVSVNLMTGTAVNGYGGTDTFGHMQIFKGGAGQDVFQVTNVQGSYDLVGGGNSDFFAFSSAFGTDTVVNFSTAHDQIYLAQNEFANFAAVQSHAQQVGGNTVITLDASDSITLQNTALSSLNAGMFHFL